MKLLLASKSPRRRQLVAALGFPYEYVDISADEHVSGELPAHRVAECIAQQKADAFPASQLEAGSVLLTADTVVVYGQQIMGKPANRAEAIDMLHSLSGHRHTVYTGVCLRAPDNRVSFTESTDVYFKKLSQATIEHYVDTYQPYDKAGAYGIQEWIGMVGVERIDGCYYNVMGLPVARIYESLSSKFLSR